MKNEFWESATLCSIIFFIAVLAALIGFINILHDGQVRAAKAAMTDGRVCQ